MTTAQNTLHATIQYRVLGTTARTDSGDVRTMANFTICLNY